MDVWLAVRVQVDVADMVDVALPVWVGVLEGVAAGVVVTVAV